jgi:transcriptional regulator with XRE-family HTH domain
MSSLRRPPAGQAIRDRIASNLASARERAGLSQAQLADAVGVSIASLRRWEGAQTKPQARHLFAIATALDQDDYGWIFDPPAA